MNYKMPKEDAHEISHTIGNDVRTTLQVSEDTLLLNQSAVPK